LTKLNRPDKAVKPLSLWLKLAEEMGTEPIVSVCCNLLGKIKMEQQKYDEAEFYCKKQLMAASRSSDTEVKLNCMIMLMNIFHKIGKHEENKKHISELIAYIQTVMPASTAAEVSATISEQTFDFGYFNEAAEHMAYAAGLYENVGNITEAIHCENTLAQAFAEIGKVAEAREKLKTLMGRLGQTSPPLTLSTYLQTTDTIVTEEGGNAVHIVKLSIRENKPLSRSALLVCKVDNPENGQPAIESHQILNQNKTITFNLPLPYARKGYYIAQIDVYEDGTRNRKLSTHVVLSNCEADINIVSPTPEAVAEETAGSIPVTI